MKVVRRVLWLGVLWLAGCVPVLDWREVRSEGGEVTALFPCKAEQHVRSLSLAGRSVRWVLLACSAGGTTWALAQADLADPALVGPALQALRAAAAGNLGAEAASRTLTLKVAGATPNPHSARLEFQGRAPDGRALTGQVALFAKGTRVFQASALGEALSAETADTFFDALRTGP